MRSAERSNRCEKDEEYNSIAFKLSDDTFDSGDDGFCRVPNSTGRAYQ